MINETVTRVKICLISSTVDKDRNFSTAIQEYYSASLYTSKVEIWRQDSILAGDVIKEVSNDAILRADIIIPIISIDLFKYDETVEHILLKAIDYKKSKIKEFIPLYFRTCDYKEFEIFKNLKVISSSRPFDLWENIDEVMKEVNQNLRPIIDFYHGNKKKEVGLYNTILETRDFKLVKNYLESYPNGFFYNDVQKIYDEIEVQKKESSQNILRKDWEIAVKINTIASYEKYIQIHPDSPYVEESRNRIKSLTYQDAILKKEKEKQSWDEAVFIDSIDSYSAFLLDFPDGNYSKEASVRILKIRKSIDLSNWERACFEDTIESYEHYISISSQGEYVKEAKERIKNIRKKNKSDSSYFKYLILITVIILFLFKFCGPCNYQDCPSIDKNIGDPCDDGNINTMGEIVQRDCSCSVGVKPPNKDCPEAGKNFGDPCDDYNANTINEVIQRDCNCVGVARAEDGAEEGKNIGDPYDDRNSATINDVIQRDRNRAGVARAKDCIGKGKNFGDPCDDGNINTMGEIVQRDCSCSVGVKPPNKDCPEAGKNFGDPCDDYNANTINEVIQRDCSCVGVARAKDCAEEGKNIGDPCDDRNSATINDVIQRYCNCAGVARAKDCIGKGKNFGDPCDDNNPCTNGERIMTNCDCGGGDYTPRKISDKQKTGINNLISDAWKKELNTNPGDAQGYKNIEVQYSIDENGNLRIDGVTPSNASQSVKEVLKKVKISKTEKRCDSQIVKIYLPN